MVDLVSTTNAPTTSDPTTIPHQSVRQEVEAYLDDHPRSEPLLEHVVTFLQEKKGQLQPRTCYFVVFPSFQSLWDLVHLVVKNDDSKLQAQMKRVSSLHVTSEQEARSSFAETFETLKYTPEHEDPYLFLGVGSLSFEELDLLVIHCARYDLSF